MTEFAAPAAELARELGEALGYDVDVEFLGVRDELAVPARAADDRTRLSVRLYGRVALIGPLQPDGHGRPCGQCLNRRWQVVQNRDLRDALELGGITSSAGANPYLTRFAIRAITEHARLLGLDSGDPGWPSGCARIVIIDMPTLRTGSIPLVADAECPSCGEATADSRERAVLALEPDLKPALQVFRLRSLDDLALDERLFANPACGVIGPDLLRDRTSTTTAAASGRMDLRTETYLHQTTWGGHAFSYQDSARIGILEALERYAGMHSRGKVTVTRAAYADLVASGARVLHPADVGLYRDEAYDGDRLPWKVERFREDRPIPWVWGYSLRDREPVLVPELLAYYHSAPLRERFVQDCSNGCASGTSLAEAIYFGLMEVIERDAFMLVWYGGLAVPEIDATTSASPLARFLIDRVEMHGYRARFFDARITFPVPVVIGVAERMDDGIGAMCFGAGASLAPEAALRAALVEIATDAAHLVRRTRFNYDRLLPMVDDFSRVQVLHDHPMLFGLPEMAKHASFLLSGDDKRPMADIYRDAADAIQPSESLRGDVESCVAMLAEAGHDVIVVDQTLGLQRDFGLHTVSVIVPGLLPIDFGWARQRAPHMARMRTAPRAAGLVDHDLTLADLHLVPHPFP